jgi:flagellum-specific peptidoglycan hydrolase FlgJ
LTPEEKLIIIREYNGFTKEALEDKIKSLNFKFPYIILAQSIQETGNYKSTIFRENNNLFGMKEAVLRTNLAKGTNRGHAYYDTWQDSLIDYALYSATYLSDIKTEGEYFEYLRQNYAEDKSYVTRLKALIKKNDLKSKFN